MTWRDRLLGGEDRLGWWLVPIFLVVGLAGAVLAGSLAVVYYGQQVDELRRETAEARDAIAGAADEVQDVADEALEAIAEEGAAIRDAQALPLEDVDERGLVRLQVDTEVTVPGEARAEADGSAEDQDEEPAPPADERVRVARSSVGFVVVRDGDHDYLVTTFSLLADPRRPDVPLDVPVTVRTTGGDATAEVHSWDEERDLLLLRTRLGAVEPLEWRPADEEVGAGDRVISVGLTPRLEVVRLGATLGSVDGSAWASDLPGLTALDGGPVVDVEGRVIGVRSPAAAGLGGDPAVVPVRVLCERLLRSCPP
jgi:S1-C subfamily serine protease